MPERILIWGAGAIGGTAGAFLKRAGHDVTFVDIEPDHVAAIGDPTRGLRITGPVETLRVVAPAFTPRTLSGTWDHIYLCVKSQHTEVASRALLPHLTQGGYVLSLQNGLCEQIIASVAGRKRVIGAFINYGSDWLAPGEILFGNRGAFVLGELDGRITPRLEALHATIRAGFEPGAIMTGDIQSYLWGKLGYAALLFAQALGQLGIADCLAGPNCCRSGGRSVARCTPWQRASVSASAVSTGSTPRPSRPTRPRIRLAARSTRWSRSTAPMPRRTPVSGAIWRCASAGPRSTSRCCPSWRPVPSTALSARNAASWPR
jgi:hypothetical protein